MQAGGGYILGCGAAANADAIETASGGDQGNARAIAARWALFTRAWRVVGGSFADPRKSAAGQLHCSLPAAAAPLMLGRALRRLARSAAARGRSKGLLCACIAHRTAPRA